MLVMCFTFNRILCERCIDFSNYKNLTRCGLIELYKRVAMPLPQRQNENNHSASTNKDNKETNSVNESHQNLTLLNGTNNTKININEVTKSSQTSHMKLTTPENELKCSTKKICLYNSNTVTKCNGVDKRNGDDKLDGAPSKKRQKITWP
ncbi:uncharacterized protein LOC105664069 isoform X2 [Megachile rotundata]|uniref:uncharacterized protein LOC105664069 isoform X2 n=1 Tax=Megachile rotundata TaxID=143995 RepID=UPI0006149F35|nr:PREDICTED: uncharacterized protein LOC105664069 isoform X2 [Megachile rotundata]